jgi:tRNA nucleotidyltransferase (CCA-adding enzyme)
MRLILTETESRIIGLIKRFGEGFDNSMTLRVAGGWVRDKLLGLESQDMDIAIDKTSG